MSRQVVVVATSTGRAMPIEIEPDAAGVRVDEDGYITLKFSLPLVRAPDALVAPLRFSAHVLGAQPPISTAAASRGVLATFFHRGVATTAIAAEVARRSCRNALGESFCGIVPREALALLDRCVTTVLTTLTPQTCVR